MGSDSKRRRSIQPGNSDTPTDDADLGFAVKSEIIPTLLQMLAFETGVSAAPPQPQSTGKYPKESSTEPPTWIESISSEKRTRETVLLTRAPAPSQTSTDAVCSDSAINPQQFSNWVSPEDFAVMVLDDNEDIAMQHFSSLRKDGAHDEFLLMELLAPTSVELGKRWEEDLSDFADVTIGVCRLHRILRSLHPQQNRTLDNGAHGGRVLLIPAPGEQHSFGLLLVGELMFRAGWYTDIDIDSQSSRLTVAVKQNWYEMIGISISSETRMQATKELIANLRQASCNPDIAVLVGGRVISDNPGFGDDLGADQVVGQGIDIATATAPYIPIQSLI